jgi:hypothetical protein
MLRQGDLMRRKVWLYFPDTDSLLVKNEFSWFIPYQMNAPRTWTVFAESEEDAWTKIDLAREQGVFDGNT